MAGFSGPEPPAELLAAAGRGELGGFILFRRNLGPIAAVAELTQRLLGSCPVELPPWIAVDQEGGRVQRLGPPVAQLPDMRSLGRIDDVGLTEHAAHVLGQQLHALGFNLDFAPVLDVDTNERSPVIGDRSFGPDPALVARHAIAFARGLARAAVASCGKHFPGHGDTLLDSHFALPHLSHGLQRLERVELAPFLAARAELTGVMTAHIVLDAIDPDRPATMSRRVLEGLLRGHVGFEGVIFSDDMEMKAIADHYGAVEAACEAVDAGCDVVLICHGLELCMQTHEALVRRAERDHDFADRLRQSAARSLSSRRSHLPQPLSPEAAVARLHELDPDALEKRIADAAQRHARPS
jgi:beta-N-acetylhexosaminidase